MAFYEWINAESKGTSCLSEQDFANLTQREQGFQAGQTASARNVNSALRQANLVAVALMESLNVDGSLQSTKDVLKDDILSALNSKLNYIKLSGSKSGGDITGSLVSTNKSNLGNSAKTWGRVFCDDVVYGGIYLTSKIADLENPNRPITIINYPINMEAPMRQGTIQIIKSRNLVICNIRIRGNSWIGMTKYPIFTFGANARFTPAPSYQSGVIGTCSVPQNIPNNASSIDIYYEKATTGENPTDAKLYIYPSVVMDLGGAFGQIMWFTEE